MGNFWWKLLIFEKVYHVSILNKFDPIQLSLFVKDGEGGGSVRTELLRQLLDHYTHKRNNQRKVGKPIYR